MKFRETFIQLIAKLRNFGFFHVFGASVANKMIGFLSGIILVRILSVEDYGVYTYANNILSILILFNGLGAASAVLQLCSETESKKHRLRLSSYGYLFGLRFDIILCLLILAVALIVPLPIEGSNTLLALMCFLPIPLFLVEMQTIQLRTELRNKSYAYASNINTLLLLFGSVTGAWLWQSEGLVLGRYVAIALSFVVILLVFKPAIKIRETHIEKAEKQTFIKIALISALNSGLSQLTFLVGTFVIGLLLSSSEAVATFQVATIIPAALNFIPGALMIFAYPYFARNKDNHEWVWRNYKKTMGGMIILSIAIAIVCIIGADPIVTLIFGEQYSEAISSFRILMIGFVFSGSLRAISGNLLVTQRKLIFNTITAVLSIVLLLLLNTLLIPQFGIDGAAVAQTLVMLATGLASTIYFSHLVRS